MAPRKPAPKPLQVPEDCLPACGRCAYFDPVEGSLGGYCIIDPPKVLVLNDELVSAFPQVLPTIKCGKFTRRVN